VADPVHRSTTLEVILDAAEGLLKRRGSEGLSVRAVAQEVGISVGNLQYHVPTRAKLLDAVFSRRADEFRSSLLGIVEKIDDPRDRFETIVDFWLASQLQADQVLFWHLWAISAHDVDASRTMAALYREMVDFISGLLCDMNPTLTLSSAKRRAALIVSMVEGSGLFVGHGRRPDRGLASLQVEVKNSVMEMAGHKVEKKSGSRRVGRAAQ
jgi:AcrR family transcriptional regulator